MKEELTTAMHGELRISKHDDTLLKAGDVWESVGFNAGPKDIARKAQLYGITYSDCMQFKEYWKHYIDKS